MILRHFTHRRHLKAIVTRGGLSVKDTAEPYLQFEFNPSSDHLKETFHRLQHVADIPWDETDTITLDFDFVKMQAADIDVLEQVEPFQGKIASVSANGPVRFVKNFLSLGYLTEESREQLSEYY
ncbi:MULTISPECIES: hypothetical protein [Exiguobacterium]|uniref:Uncharacterized protein n=1 Tax=Exiguobacterium antarcticum TaxID=132920 RepID=A0ABT6R2W4_9BACL|nr:MULTISPECIES: hypothetical protein [Exiguobacterium]MCT4780676.1 hypothetical protein [Exiguobacterium soli]MDI3235165.1 hypothetical protein [Exiguobacterium antarcticum]